MISRRHILKTGAAAVPSAVAAAPRYLVPATKVHARLDQIDIPGCSPEVKSKVASESK